MSIALFLLCDLAADAKFVLGMALNIFALYLILKKSKKLLFEYRKLLVIFLLSDALFTVLHAVLRPVGVVEGNLLLLYLTGPIRHRYWIGLYTACVSGSFLILAFHFVYRVLAAKNKTTSSLQLTANRLLWMFALLTVEYCAWGFVTLAFEFEPRYEKAARSHFESVNRTFPDRPEDEFIIYLGQVDGHLNGPALANALTLTGIMAATGTAIVASCIVIVRILMTTKVAKSQWRKQQTQLFIALLVQLFIPLVTLYVPVGIYVLTPFIPNNQLRTPEWILTTLYSWFPIADLISIIVLIADNRKACVAMVTGVFKRGPNQSSTTKIAPSQSSRTAVQ